MKRVLLFLVSVFCFALGYGQLNLGDIAIIGVSVDDEEILVVALEAIPSGESIFFTDEEWGGSSFNSGEGFYEWVTPSISAGTVFTIETSGTSVGGTVTQRAGSFALGNSGDGVYLYQTSTNVYNTGTYTILGFAGEDAGDAGTLSGTGLTLGSNAIYFGGDNGIYVGARTGQDAATYLSLIYGSSWTTSGSSQTFDMTDFTFMAAGCSISSLGITNTTCSDNGTSANTTDDIISFDLNPTGSTLGTNYDVTVSSGTVSPTAAAYGSATSFTMQSGSAGSGNVTITITDQTTGTCTDNEVLTDPGSCSVTPCTTPSAQATALTFANITASSIDVSFTAASPVADKYLVVQSTTATLSSNPVDATTYAVSSSLGGGTVVFNGSVTSFTTSGLTASTQYYYHVYAYNDIACSAGPTYLSPALVDDETTIVGPTCFFTDDFSGTLASWSNTTDWNITTGELKHGLSGVSGNSYIYADVGSQDLTAGDYEWSFCISNGNWDPSGSNSFTQFLLSSNSNLQTSGTGYAVGVNSIGTSDLLTLYSVNSGSYSAIVTSSFNWDNNDDVCVRITRTASGLWELFYDDNGSGELSAGSATNTTYTTGQFLGTWFEFSSSRAGLLYVDDIQICGTPASPSPEINIIGLATDIPDGNMIISSGDDTDFGDLLITAGTNPNTFTIQNTGTADLTITSVMSSNNAEFSVPTTSSVITPGNDLDFTVTFDPTATGTRTSMITILSDDTDEGTYTFNIAGNGTAIPDIVLNSANPAISASTIVEGSDENVIYAFDLSVSTYEAVLTEIIINTSGSFSNSNITNIKAWYSSDNIFDSGLDTQLGNNMTNVGGTYTTTAFSQSIALSTTGYIFVTTDLSCPATAGSTILVDAITTADLTFISGNTTGSSSASEVHTIVDDTPLNVTALTTSNCESGGATISWVDAIACFDNYIVVASLSSLVTSPSGNGSLYSANNVFGNGDAFDDGYVVYKDDGTSVNITGLSNNTNYIYTVFTRNANTWSSGVEVNCTPVIPIPDNACGVNDIQTSINFSGVSTVADINVFVSIEHTFRADLRIEIASPLGTIVELFDGSNSGGQDNLEVIFDDAGIPISSSAHIIDGTADETITSDVDLLSIFNGEMSDGLWTITICDGASGDIGSLIDWNIDITEACTPTHTFTSLIPESGPEETEIVISGTGFTASTTANFGGINATVEFLDDTTLVVHVPANAATGAITLIEAACNIQTSTFSVIEESGSCIGSLGSFTDLFISEVYDADVNNVWYVELYNPTSSPIDLAAGDYEIDRYADLTTTTISVNVDLTGIVPANSIFLLSLGTSANTCSNTFDINTNSGGINAEDRNVLTKGGVDIDVVEFPNQTGYTIKRLGSANGPTVTFNAADWDLLLVEECSDLGLSPVVTYSNPTVSSLNNASDCFLLNFNISATEGDLSTVGDLTYQWYFNDGIATGWTSVNNINLTGFSILGEMSNNLTISEGLNSLDELHSYQFYCEVTEAGSCINVSNAEKFSFDNERYFRSASAGNWNVASNWEMANSALGPWSAACAYPTDANSDYISIESGNDIILNIDLIADQIIIQSGAKLTLDEKLTIENGNTSGEDLEVIGTLQDNGNTTNGIDFVNGGTWLLGLDGTIIKTNTSSVNKYRDYYETGIANIPATAHWAYVADGLSDVSVAAISMFYPNLYFETTTAAYNANSLNESFKGASGFITVKGNLEIGYGTISGGTGTYKVYNNNFNPQAMLILGDVYIENGSEFNNAIYNNGAATSSVDNGTGIEVKGSFLVDGILDMTNGTGITKMSGIAKQDIVSTGTGEFKTYEFEIDNITHTELEDIDLIITNTLRFTNGKIITDISKPDVVFVQSILTSAIVGANTSGLDKFVEGKLQWTTDGLSAYTFPVGYAAPMGAQGFTINVNGNSGSEILGFLDLNITSPTQLYAYCDLEAHPGGGTINAGNGNVGYDGVLDQIEFNEESPLQWDITNPAGGINSYELTVLATGVQSIPGVVTTANGVDVRYLMKNGQPGNPGVTTISGAPSFSATGFEACPNQFTLSNLMSFSKFTLNGSTASNTTLPIELLHFQAESIDENVLVSWATVTEINNDFFSVERSANGFDFEVIGKLKGAGNFSGKLDYQMLDKTPLDRISYYRLKQTDFDGSFEYSKIVIINRINKTDLDVNIYPNPVSDYLFISTNDKINNNTFIQIFDITGRKIREYNLNQLEQKASVKLDVSILLPGTYVVKLNSMEIQRTLNFIKK